MFTEKNHPWRRLKEAPLDLAAWQALAQGYAEHEQRWQLAYVVRQISRLKAVPEGEVLASLPPPKRAGLEAPPKRAGQSKRKGQEALAQPQGLAPLEGLAGLPGLDRVEAALSMASMADAPERGQQLQAWLQKQPGDWLGWLFWARVLDFGLQADATADTPLGAQALAQAQALEYLPGESRHLLASWRAKAGQAAAAVAVLTPLVDVRPLRHGSMVYLGEALLRVGHFQAAELAFSRASHSNNPVLLSWLADVVYRNNYWQEAIDVLVKATTLQPDNAELWLKLAGMQAQVYQLSECRNSLAQIQRLDPGNERAALLEIGLLGQLGDGQAYFKAFESHLQAGQQANSRQISSVLMTALYQDTLSAQEMAQLHRRLTAPLEREHALVAAPSPEKRLKRAQRADPSKLRVGYVTGDLHRQHPVNIFMLPLLEQQKASALEVYIYHTGTMFDHYTARAQACADVWVEAAGWDDETLHQQIVRDEVDVLVDLAGHTASHRLGVFVKRSAPVQASFLGYPHSTGLACMDYLIGDAVVSPEAHAPLFSEKIARLSGPVFCWSSVDDYPLPAQARRSGPVVFGSFNNPLKLSPRTIALWARVLHAVPDAVLLLKAPSFRNDEVCGRFRSLFAQHGIGAERLLLRGPSELSEMMQEYGDIDIALDPLPYNGGTTSLQALWMGVPLVSLLGENFASRMGASFLTTLGKTEWMACDEDAYVQIAQGMAQEVDAIREGRQALREAMQASALCDIERYARDFERVLRSMA